MDRLRQPVRVIRQSPCGGVFPPVMEPPFNPVQLDQIQAHGAGGIAGNAGGFQPIGGQFLHKPIRQAVGPDTADIADGRLWPQQLRHMPDRIERIARIAAPEQPVADRGQFQHHLANRDHMFVWKRHHAPPSARLSYMRPVSQSGQSRSKNDCAPSSNGRFGRVER